MKLLHIFFVMIAVITFSTPSDAMMRHKPQHPVCGGSGGYGDRGNHQPICYDFWKLKKARQVKQCIENLKRWIVLHPHHPNIGEAEELIREGMGILDKINEAFEFCCRSGLPKSKQVYSWLLDWIKDYIHRVEQFLAENP